jgi:hypothetical protein
LSCNPSLISAIWAAVVSEPAAPANRKPMRIGAFCACAVIDDAKNDGSDEPQ